MNDPVTTLWIGELSRLECLCFRSWMHHGHPFHLWAYDVPEGVPRGVEVHDAAEILPRDAIFRYGKHAEKHGAFAQEDGGYGGFANLWRYHYLHRYGGWWVDADLIALKPLDFKTPYLFGAAVRRRIYNGLMRTPPGTAFTADLIAAAEAMGRDVKFCESGPALLPRMVRAHGLQAFIRKTKTFYPHHWSKWQIPFQPDRPLPTSYTIHLWNEVLRRKGFDKNADYPPTCQIEKIRRLVGEA
jgi:hypothetical protein